MRPSTSPLERLHRRRRRWQRVRLTAGLAMTGALLLAAVAAPALAPYAPEWADPAEALQPASARHWLGTDERGADLLAQLVWGARVAAIVGFGTVAVSAAVGTAVGALAGAAGGWVDEVAMRLVDVALSFPGILLAVFVIFLTQTPGTAAVIGALSATGWAPYARLVRGQVLAARPRLHVEAARAVGAGPLRVLVVHMLPEAVGPLVVQATFGVAGAVLAESTLSFLGLGPQGMPSWGRLLDEGAVLFLRTPRMALAGGAAIALTVLSINLLGEALREWLAPAAGGTA